MQSKHVGNDLYMLFLAVFVCSLTCSAMRLNEDENRTLRLNDGEHTVMRLHEDENQDESSLSDQSEQRDGLGVLSAAEIDLVRNFRAQQRPPRYALKRTISVPKLRTNGISGAPARARNQLRRTQSAYLEPVSSNLTSTLGGTREPGGCTLGGTPTVADIIWKVLTDYGVTDVFGLPGGGIINFMKAKPSGVRWRNIGHEEMNAFVAQSYGLYKGNAGVLVTTHGPGAAATINPVYNAVEEVKPLLHIMQFTKDWSTEGHGAYNPHLFQQWPVHTVLGGVTEFVYYLRDPKDTETITKHAFRTATMLRTASVLLVEEALVPCAAVPTGTFPQSELPLTPQLGSHGRPGEFILNKLVRGEDPRNPDPPQRIISNKLLVVLEGSLKPEDRPNVEQFLRVNRLPYVSTFKARLKFPDGAGSYFGCVGSLGLPKAHYALRQAEHILIINPQAGGLGTESFYGRRFGIDSKLVAPAAIVTQITDSAVLGHHCFFKVRTREERRASQARGGGNFVVESITAALSSLTIVGDQSAFVAMLDQFKTAVGGQGTGRPRPRSLLEEYASTAAQVLKEVHKKAPAGQAPGVMTGVGNHWYAIGKYMAGMEKAEYFGPTNWGCIGVGLPNALGLYYATGKPVWVFEGDGGAAYASVAFNYAMSHKTVLPLTVTVLIDSYYSAVTVNDYVCNKCKQADAACGSCGIPRSIPDADNVQTNIQNLLPPVDGRHIFHFTNVKAYGSFLMSAPVANHLRILLVTMPASAGNANGQVYEMEYTNAYLQALAKAPPDKASVNAAKAALLRNGVIF